MSNVINLLSQIFGECKINLMPNKNTDAETFFCTIGDKVLSYDEISKLMKSRVHFGPFSDSFMFELLLLQLKLDEGKRKISENPPENFNNQFFALIFEKVFLLSPEYIDEFESDDLVRIRVFDFISKQKWFRNLVNVADYINEYLDYHKEEVAKVILSRADHIEQDPEIWLGKRGTLLS